MKWILYELLSLLPPPSLPWSSSLDVFLIWFLWRNILLFEDFFTIPFNILEIILLSLCGLRSKSLYGDDLWGLSVLTWWCQWWAFLSFKSQKICHSTSSKNVQLPFRYRLLLACARKAIFLWILLYKTFLDNRLNVNHIIRMSSNVDHSA